MLVDTNPHFKADTDPYQPSFTNTQKLYFITTLSAKMSVSHKSSAPTALTQ